MIICTYFNWSTQVGHKNYGKELTLAFEPGKFLVSEAGVFLAKVNVVKQTTSTVFAQIDSGFNHLIRPMLYGSQHEIFNISNPKGRERFYSVVGYICETDTFANNRRINEINEGDILCFKKNVYLLNRCFQLFVQVLDHCQWKSFQDEFQKVLRRPQLWRPRH